MRISPTAQIVASGVGILALVCLVSAAAYLAVPPQDFVSVSVATNALGILVALIAWAGVPWTRRSKDRQIAGPKRWTEWLGMFLVSLPLSAFFLFIDCGWHLPKELGGTACDGHPGISVIFTVSAVSLTAIALPSAIRAWLLELMSPSSSSRE